MLIGVGQSTFETLNHNQIIELDFFDIYFDLGLDSVSSANEDGCGGALLNAEYMNKIEINLIN